MGNVRRQRGGEIERERARDKYSSLALSLSLSFFYIYFVIFFFLLFFKKATSLRCAHLYRLPPEVIIIKLLYYIDIVTKIFLK